jgi:hypothetical protein
MGTWTAADIGAYDQFLAGADSEVGRLAAALRIGTGEVGEHQAMADISLLVNGREPRELTGLLMASLRRLNEESSPMPSTSGRLKTFVDSNLGGLIIGFVLVLIICGGFGLFVAYA